MLKPISKIQPLSQSQIQKLGTIPSSLGAINKIKPIQRINQPVNSTGDFVDYNDPNAINSIADVLTRTEKDKNPTGAIYAVGGALDIAGDFVKIPGVDIALNVVGKLTKAGALIADKDFRHYVRDYFIRPALDGNWSAVGYNALQGFSETADLLAQPIKAFSSLAHGGSQQGLDNLKASAAGALGIDTGYGRVNYDYDTGNLFADMALEFVSDPMNVLDIAGGITSYSAKSTKGLDGVSKYKHARYAKAKAGTGKSAVYPGPFEFMSRSNKKRERAMRKEFRQRKAHAKYVDKRTAAINKDYGVIKLNKQEEYLAKWKNTFKEWAKEDPKYAAKDYQTNEGILNQLEAGSLDLGYNADMLRIEQGRQEALRQLSGSSSITPTAETDIVQDAQAKAFVDTVEAQYDPGRFDNLDKAANKVTALESAPESVRNTKIWQLAYSKAKANYDRIRTTVKTSAGDYADKTLLSEEAFETLSNISTRPSDNPELLRNVGRATTTIIKTATTVSSVADAVDKQVLHAATWKIPSTVIKPIKFIGRNVMDFAKYKVFMKKLNESLENNNEQFFKKYYTKEGYLDLSAFPKFYPEYAEHVHKVKLRYKDVVQQTGDAVLTPDITALRNKLRASAANLDASIPTVKIGDDTLTQIDDLLKTLREALPSVLPANLPVNTIPDKLVAIRKIINYLEKLAAEDPTNTLKGSIDNVILKLELFVNVTKKAISIEDKKAFIAQYHNTLRYVDQYAKFEQVFVDFENQTKNFKNLLNLHVKRVNEGKVSEAELKKYYELIRSKFPDRVPALSGTPTVEDYKEAYGTCVTLIKGTLESQYASLKSRYLEAIKDPYQKRQMVNRFYQKPLTDEANPVFTTGDMEDYVKNIWPSTARVNFDYARRYKDIAEHLTHNATSWKEVLGIAKDFFDKETYDVLENIHKGMHLYLKQKVDLDELTKFANKLTVAKYVDSDTLKELDAFVESAQSLHDDLITFTKTPLAIDTELVRNVREIQDLINQIRKYITGKLNHKTKTSEKLYDVMRITYKPKHTVVKDEDLAGVLKVKDGSSPFIISGKARISYKTPAHYQTEYTKAPLPKGESFYRYPSEDLAKFELPNYSNIKINPSEFNKNIISPAQRIASIIKNIREGFKDAAETYDAAQKKLYDEAVAAIEKEEKLSASYEAKIKELIDAQNPDKKVIVTRTKKDGSKTVEVLTVKELMTDPSKSPILKPIYNRTADAATFELYKKQATDVVEAFNELCNSTGSQDKYDIMRDLEVYSINERVLVEQGHREGSPYWKPHGTKKYENAAELVKDFVEFSKKESVNYKGDLQAALLKHEDKLFELYKQKPYALWAMFKTLLMGKDSTSSVDQFINKLIDSVNNASEHAHIYAARVDDISGFDKAFSSAYQFANDYKDFSSITVRDSATVNALLKAPKAFVNLVEILPYNDRTRPFIEAVESWSSTKLDVQETINIDIDRKAFGVYLSSTASTLNSISDPAIREIFNNISNPNHASGTILGELLYRASLKTTDTSNGAWIRDLNIGGIFNGDDSTLDHVNEQLKLLVSSADAFNRQSNLAEQIMLNPILDLGDDPADPKSVILKIVMFDTLDYFQKKNGAETWERFEEFFKDYKEHLITNYMLRQSKQSLSLDYIRDTYFTGAISKKVKALGKSHSADVDTHITDYFYQEWQKKHKGVPLFEKDPNKLYFCFDTEFTVVKGITYENSLGNISYNNYVPLEIAYKQMDDVHGKSSTAYKAVDKRIRPTEEQIKNNIDDRTYTFFSGVHGKPYGEAEFREEWCKPEYKERDEVFSDFFRELLDIERTQGKEICLVAHNGALADIPLIEYEFNRIKHSLIKKSSKDAADASKPFYSLMEAETWFSRLKANSIDTLVEARKQSGIAAVTTAQWDEIRRLLIEHVYDSRGSMRLMRALDNNFFTAVNSLISTIKRNPTIDSVVLDAKGNPRTVRETFNIAGDIRPNGDILMEELSNMRNTIRDKLKGYKTDLLNQYCFYDDVFTDMKIEIDGVRVNNITDLNNKIGALSYFGFRRLSTPDLKVFFNESVLQHTVESTYAIRLVEKLTASKDKIRYPSYLAPYKQDLADALKNTVEFINENYRYDFTVHILKDNEFLGPNVEQYVKEVTPSWLKVFEYVKTDDPVATFVMLRYIWNALNNNAQFVEKGLPPIPEHIKELFEGLNNPLYSNSVEPDYEGLRILLDPMYDKHKAFEKVRSHYRNKVAVCCNNATERLNTVSEYLEATNKTGYTKYTRYKTNQITNKIIPLVEFFSKRDEAYLKKAGEAFELIPQKQLDNRFLDFNKDKASKLYNELLYNPLHTAIIHTSELTKYGDIESILKESSINYRVVNDVAYLYLDNAELSKYTFAKGKVYLEDAEIPRTQYAEAVSDDITEVHELRNAVAELYELVPEYFSDSAGKTFSTEQLREIYNRLPDFIQNELPKAPMLLRSEVFESGPIINNMLLGKWHQSGMFFGSAAQDPITAYAISSQFVTKDLETRTQWLHYFFDNTDGLALSLDDKGNLIDNILLDTYDFQSVADLCAALDSSKYTLTALVPDGTNIRVMELPLSNPGFVIKLIETRKIPIRLTTKPEALTIKNIIERPSYNKLQQAWNLGIRLFKNAVLASLGTFLRNVFDTFLKTTIDIGLGNTMNYSFEAHKLRREYNRVVELATSCSFSLDDGSKSFGLLNDKALDYVFSPAHAALLKAEGINMDRETFEFIRVFKESDAAAAMHHIQENQNRYRKAFLKSEDHLNNPDLTFNDWLKQQNTLKGALKKEGPEKRKAVKNAVEGIYSAAISGIMMPTSYIEDVNRLAMYLKYSDEGLLTKDAIFQRIKDTHFDFNYKTQVTSKIEQFIPFYNFTKENAVYWMRLLEEHPEIAMAITDAMTPVLDLDSYDVEELERNKSALNAITNGYVRVDKRTNLMLKANPSFMDAFMLFANPVEAFQQGCIINTPESLDALTKWEGGWKDIIVDDLNSLVPWVPTIAQRVEAVERNQKRLTKQFESNQTLLIRQGLTRAAATVSSTFAVPARYRNAKYTSGEYYKHWRNYRSPVRSIYTKTGISKLQILMEPVSPDNVKYKLGVMQSFVNRQ